MNDDAIQSHLWTKSFIILTTSNFLLFFCLHIMVLPLPVYVKEQFLPNDFTVSLVTSVFSISAIISRFLSAYLMRSVNRNWLLVCGIAVFALSTLLFSFANSVVAILLLRVAYGIGFGMISTVLPTLVAEIIPPRRMGEGIGYYGLSNNFAMSMGPVFGLAMLGSYGFETLTVSGVSFILLIVPLLLWNRSLSPAMEQKFPRALEESGKGRSKGIRKLLLPISLSFILSVAFGGIITFLALFGRENGIQNVGWFFLINAVSMMLIRPISGRLFDSKGHGIIVIPGALLIMIGLIVLSFSNSLVLFMIAALLYGLGVGTLQPTLQAWTLREAAPEQYGMANSLFYNSIDFGIAIGAMMLGTIASVSNYSIMYRYSACLMVVFLIVYILFISRNRTLS